MPAMEHIRIRRGRARIRRIPLWLIDHEIPDHERGIGDIENQPAHHAPAHVVFVEYPRTGHFAQVVRDRLAVVRAGRQVETRRKQSRGNPPEKAK